MTLVLLAVAGAAVCSGSAAVLQASAVARLPQADSISAGFVGRLARSPRYLLALMLVAAGFGLSILALRTLPLFVVQAGRASSLAITAVLSVLLLRVRLRTAEVIAVIGIGAAPECDGQVLVLHDILGVSPGKPARFVKNFLACRTDGIDGAVLAYDESVKNGSFPAAEHCFE